MVVGASQSQAGKEPGRKSAPPLLQRGRGVDLIGNCSCSPANWFIFNLGTEPQKGLLAAVY